LDLRRRVERVGGWRRLHNEELHDLILHQILIGRSIERRRRWTGHVTRMGDMINAYNILVRKLGRKRPLGRPRCVWEDNIRMDLREIGWEVTDWIHPGEDKDHWWDLVKMLTNVRVL
jgi:hypothetical protein